MRRHAVRCHSGFVAKNFNADFYVTCATVIPVLFLAVAVQGRAYESVLRAARMAAQARHGKRWTRQLGPVGIAVSLRLIAYAVVFAGGYGEFLALWALYLRSELRGMRASVLAATVALVVVVSAGPALAYLGMGDTLEKLEHLPRRTASDEYEGAEDQSGDPRP